MSEVLHRPLTIAEYDQAAAAYCAALPLEHFMEAIPAATQREITVESLAVLRERRGDVQVFNELLVQYLFQGRLRQVVPDNMARISRDETVTLSSFNVELEPVGPLLVLEYVSEGSERKDYEDNFRRYEEELHVPYYLIFHPRRQDLQLYRHIGAEYAAVRPNAAGRLLIEPLDVEVAIVDRWVRYWHQGDLLELPKELLRRIDAEKRRADVAEALAAFEKDRADKEKARAETEQARAEQADRKAGQAKRKAERADQKAKQAKRNEEQAKRNEEQAKRNEEQAKRNEEQAKRNEEQANLRAELDRQARAASDSEVTRLRAELDRFRKDKTTPE